MFPKILFCLYTTGTRKIGSLDALINSNLSIETTNRSQHLLPGKWIQFFPRFFHPIQDKAFKLRPQFMVLHHITVCRILFACGPFSSAVSRRISRRVWGPDS